MSRTQIIAQLRAWIRDWAIDPADAGEILSEIGADGIDRETFGDWLDGAGYPELATQAYALGETL